jgi:hypothetical protein
MSVSRTFFFFFFFFFWGGGGGGGGGGWIFAILQERFCQKEHFSQTPYFLRGAKFVHKMIFFNQGKKTKIIATIAYKTKIIATIAYKGS